MTPQEKIEQARRVRRQAIGAALVVAVASIAAGLFVEVIKIGLERATQ